jgi:hypothetical protein
MSLNVYHLFTDRQLYDIREDSNCGNVYPLCLHCVCSEADIQPSTWHCVISIDGVYAQVSTPHRHLSLVTSLIPFAHGLSLSYSAIRSV